MNPFRIERLQLNWIICKDDNNNNTIWCPLGTVALDHNLLDNVYGVYIIWYWDNNGQRQVHKVGQAKDDEIRERLKDHKRNYGSTYNNNTLYVTWAGVPIEKIDGVEKYLGEKLRPQDVYPNAIPIKVNLPWETT